MSRFPMLGGLPTSGGIPYLSPPFIMLIIIAYTGHYVLSRQESKRVQDATLKAAADKEAERAAREAARSAKALRSSDVRSKGLPASYRPTGDPSPRQVTTGSSGSSRPSSKMNYFMTMQGPGRPALVPMQHGLKGPGDGEMWWNHVPTDAGDLMAPPVDPRDARKLAKNPWAAEMVGREIDTLKLERKLKGEEERYGKVANVLQTVLGFLLCGVDMRLGIGESRYPLRDARLSPGQPH